ncbi:MAG: hypothetical protein RL762_387 [Bacteroidota bacterium]|jgi:hypothetical protein
MSSSASRQRKKQALENEAAIYRPSKEAIAHFFTNLELKPMTKEEIREARINSYPTVF